MNQSDFSYAKKFRGEANINSINSTQSVIKLLKIVQNSPNSTISEIKLINQLRDPQRFKTNLISSMSTDIVYKKSDFKKKIPIQSSEQIINLPSIKRSQPYNLFKFGLQGLPLLDPKRKNMLSSELPTVSLQKQKIEIKLQSIRSRNNIYNVNEFEDSLEMKKNQLEHGQNRRRIHTELENQSISCSNRKQKKQRKQKQIAKLEKILLTKVNQQQQSAKKSKTITKYHFCEAWEQQVNDIEAINGWHYTIDDAIPLRKV